MAKKSKLSRTERAHLRRAGDGKLNYLALNLHREFFDAIFAGSKKTEYRADTEFWRARLVGRKYREIHFRNGYATKAPFMRVEFKRLRHMGQGRDAYFAIRLGRVLEVKHYKPG
jgi:hypothetical protein